MNTSTTTIDNFFPLNYSFESLENDIIGLIRSHLQKFDMKSNNFSIDISGIIALKKSMNPKNDEQLRSGYQSSTTSNNEFSRQAIVLKLSSVVENVNGYIRKNPVQECRTNVHLPQKDPISINISNIHHVNTIQNLDTGSNSTTMSIKQEPPFLDGSIGDNEKEKEKLSSLSTSTTDIKNVSRNASMITCQRCGQTFSNSRYLYLHMKKVHLVCSICGGTCVSRSKLARHINCHTGERPFICETCGDAFTNKPNLVRHNRIHTGERPYKCGKCGRYFPHKQTITRMTHRCNEKRHVGSSPKKSSHRNKVNTTISKSMSSHKAKKWASKNGANHHKKLNVTANEHDSKMATTVFNSREKDIAIETEIIVSSQDDIEELSKIDDVPTTTLVDIENISFKNFQHSKDTPLEDMIFCKICDSEHDSAIIHFE